MQPEGALFLCTTISSVVKWPKDRASRLAVCHPLEEFLYGEVAPRPAAGVAVEADMAAGLRHHREEPLIAGPVEFAIVLDGNPGIVARRQHHGRHANFGHELRGGAERIVVLGAAEAIARRDE